MFNAPLPDFLAAHFAKKQIKSLNPVQKASLDKGLFSQTNLLVSAPTASGKTLIAVMAAAQFLERNKSCMCIAPISPASCKTAVLKHKKSSSIFVALKKVSFSEQQTSTEVFCEPSLSLDCTRCSMQLPIDSSTRASYAHIKSQNKPQKIVYLVPLKALASEKAREFKEIFAPAGYEVALSMGDLDSASEYLHKYSIIILTVEKLDSLIRHHAHWTKEIGLVIVDEIHLLNDAERGPNLEVLLTLLRSTIKPRIIGLSATIGNAEELAQWLEAELVVSDWRPVKLKKGIGREGEIIFYD